MRLMGCCEKGNQEGVEAYKCKCFTDKMTGIVALVVAVAMIVVALVVASGIFGAGKMYFVAAGLAVGSIAPAALAAYKLSCKPLAVQTLGSFEAVRRGSSEE